MVEKNEGGGMPVDAYAHLDWYKDALPEALGQIETHRILTMAVPWTCRPI